jgi:uncharacterized caspase-like protein
MLRIQSLLAVMLGMLLAALPAAAAEKRVALVVGNSAYVNAAPLPNPVNDAGAIAKALTEAGFEVIVGLDLDKPAFDGKVRDFARALDGADVALFFYAGHGLQVAGRNYLVPIDASMQKERDLDFEGVSVDFVLKQMEIDRENKTNVVFLDACRDNPLARNLARSMGTRSASIGKGLAQVETGVGTFISYSTQPGNVALDGDGANSPFTTALVKGVRNQGRNLTTVMVDVRKDVLAATQGKQVPWDHSSLTGDFYFHLAAAPGAIPGGGALAAAPDVQERLRQLEEELRKKSDPEQTAKVVELAQAKEQVRSAVEANKADQQQIFEVQMARGRDGGGAEASMEVGKIQLRMVRRNQQISKVRERIAELEKDLGLPSSAAADAKK